MRAVPTIGNRPRGHGARNQACMSLERLERARLCPPYKRDPVSSGPAVAHQQPTLLQIRRGNVADAQAADLLQEYEAKIAALERMVGRQALEIEFLRGL